MHVIDMIFFWADMEPSRPAIMLPDRMLTYRGLANAIEAIAARLSERIPDKNETVAVALESDTLLLATCFAALRSGLTVVPAQRGMFAQLVTNGIKTVVTDGDTPPDLSRILFDDSWLAARGAPPGSLPRTKGGYGDVIFFTSGTTGTPKMSRETCASGVARAELSVFLGLSEYARALIMPGLNTHFGFNLACDILRLGKTACFCPMGEQLLWMINAFGIDFIHASSNQALALCQLAEKHPEYSFNSVRTVRVGGATPPKALVDRIRSRLCKEVTVIYASTEGSQAATAPYSAIEHVANAVGVLVPWTDLQIVDADDKVLPAGAQGKVRYRNAYFLNGPSAGSKDQWFYPGDLGMVTADGILCITGRGDNVINRGGVKVSADRVEERLLACPGVKDAGVCGIEGLSEMTQLWIAVVPDRDFKPAEFRQFIQSDDALHESLGTDIDQVFIVEDIPRGELGKIRRIELRNKLFDMLKAAVAGAR